jgi:arsenate reductase (glutaredoxin)
MDLRGNSMADDEPILFWKKTCSTCRNAREAVSKAGAPFAEREYFKEPFTEDELRALLAGRPVADFFSWRSPTARKLGLSVKRTSLTEDELIRMMIEEPNLIRRPLFSVKGDLVAGFDPQARQRLSDLLGITIEGPAPKR